MPSKHIEISAATESLLSGFIAQNPVKMYKPVVRYRVQRKISTIFQVLFKDPIGFKGPPNRNIISQSLKNTHSQSILIRP